MRSLGILLANRNLLPLLYRRNQRGLRRRRSERMHHLGLQPAQQHRSFRLPLQDWPSQQRGRVNIHRHPDRVNDLLRQSTTSARRHRNRVDVHQHLNIFSVHQHHHNLEDQTNPNHSTRISQTNQFQGQSQRSFHHRRFVRNDSLRSINARVHQTRPLRMTPLFPPLPPPHLHASHLGYSRVRALKQKAYRHHQLVKLDGVMVKAHLPPICLLNPSQMQSWPGH